MQTIQNLKQKLRAPGEFTNITIGTNQETIQVLSKDLFNALPDFYITNASVNLRREPGLAGSLLLTISRGSVLESRGFNPIKLNGFDWVNVKYGDKLGWCALQFLDLIDKPQPQLNVPYIRQEGTGATQFRNDCGCACVAMLLKYHLNLSVSVDQLARDTSLVTNDNGLTTQQLEVLSRKYGLIKSVNNNLSIGLIKTQIDNGNPVVMLINYTFITKRQNKSDFGQHFVVVTGYDNNNIIINDPDFWYPNEEVGHNMVIPNNEFQDAIYYASPRYQGLI